MNQTQTTTTIWITKYALTKGIQKCEGRLTEYGAYYGPGFQCYVRKSSFFTSEMEAREAACIMRDRKVNSLRKKLEKIQKMVF